MQNKHIANASLGILAAIAASTKSCKCTLNPNRREGLRKGLMK